MILTQKSVFFLGTMMMLASWHQGTELAIAQILPDQTLGDESSLVVPDVVIQGNRAVRIEGGASRGANLFHSFDQFNIRENERIYFGNPIGIERILSRVTGDDISDILGTLGVDGNADLFFLNPNGIIFGDNAQLDIGGSFLASTANSFTLSDGNIFSATDPQAVPLLTINTTLGLQPGGTQQGNIISSGDWDASGDLILDGYDILISGNLQSGQDMLLRGRNNIQITDNGTNPTQIAAEGTLTIEGETLTLSSVQSDSQLLSRDDMILRSANPIASDLTFGSGADFRVEQLDGQLGAMNSDRGTIIYALADIELGNYQGASLQILTSGNVNIPGFIFINRPSTRALSPEKVALSNDVPVSLNPAEGPTVDIRAGIEPRLLSRLAARKDKVFLDSERLQSPTNSDINIQRIDLRGLRTGTVLLTNQYEPVLEQDGDITLGIITTDGGDLFSDSRNELILTGAISAGGSASSLLPRAGGNIILVSKDDINLVPFSENIVSIPTSIITQGTAGGSIQIETNGDIQFSEGIIGTLIFPNDPEIQGGEISISARSLSMDQSASISTQVNGQGKAGDIVIDVAQNFVMDGEESRNLPPPLDGTITNIISQALENTTGDTGDISINANSLTLKNGGLITTFNGGVGNAGDVEVSIDDLVRIQGIYRSDTVPNISRLNSTVVNGNSGTIDISARRVQIRDGGSVSSFVSQNGNAGDINVNARTVRLSGQTEDTFLGADLILRSSIVTNVVFGASGNGGDINLNVGDLTLRDGSSLQSAMSGTGDAGNINVLARGNISLDQSFINSILAPGAKGAGGDIVIEGTSLLLRNGAQINAGVSQTEPSLGEGRGNGGSITIQTSNRVDISGFREGEETFDNPLNILQGQTEGVNPATPTIPSFFAGGFSTALVTSTGQGASGRGGDILIDTNLFKLSDGALVEALTANESRAGDINIQANRLEITEGAQILATTSDAGRAGNITLDILDSAILSGRDPTFENRLQRFGADNVPNQGPFSGLFSNTQTGSTGKGGDITIRTSGTLGITEGAQLLASTEGAGRAGNITVGLPESTINEQTQNPPDLIQLTNGLISIKVDDEASGNGGTIDIQGQQIQLIDDSQILASTAGAGRAGTVTIRSTVLDVQDSQVSTTTEGDRRAGDINIFVEDEITLSGETDDGEGAGFLANTIEGSTGNGGSIFIDPRRVTLANGAQITVDSQGTGKGGNIDLVAGTLLLSGESSILAETISNTGGNITLSLTDLLALQDKSRISTTAGTADAGGNGGDIDITASFIVALPNENSDISANAFSGDGGNIEIVAQDLFGIEFRPELTNLSDITATSESGLDGEITIATLGIDPVQAVAELPVETAQPPLSQGCTPGGGQGRFINAGQGGTPLGPGDVRGSDRAWEDISPPESPSEIVEAQNWTLNDEGQIVLHSNFDDKSSLFTCQGYQI